MNYEAFKAVVKENFLRYLPEKYRDAVLDIRPVMKINRILDELTVLTDDGPGMVPLVFVNKMYEQYRACGDMEAVFRDVAQKYAEVRDDVKGYELDVDLENVKDNVIMWLINTEQNRELLESVPNRKFHDLSVIYRWVVECTPDSIGSVSISDIVAEEIGMSEEELFRCAVENTRRIDPVRITRMSDLLGGISEEIDIPQEIREEMERENRILENMWIISNCSGTNGAVSMLYEENLHQLAEKLGDDLFILPSSIHEVIAIPTEMAEKNPTQLTEMVYEVNMSILKLEERLSNSVYHYDRNARKVTLAAESQEKRLDGKTTELPLIPEENKTR